MIENYESWIRNFASENPTLKESSHQACQEMVEKFPELWLESA